MGDVSKAVSKAGEKLHSVRATDDQAAIFEGVFSWRSAWCMMLWVLCFICSVVMMVLAYQGAAFELISEEFSWIRDRNPLYGPAEQPNDAKLRDINQMFRYHLPQVALWYSLAAASLGLFTVFYFTNSMLLEDRGSKRAVDICSLFSHGVAVYMERTIPVICVFLFFGGWYVYATAGAGTFACFIVGSVLNLVSTRVGVSMTVEGTSRLTHSMGNDLAECIQIGIRTGAIGGLLATSLALGGMAGMWILIRDTSSLSGFGSGASIVSFYLRIGGGIFSKGAEIGGDLVGEMDEHRKDEERRIFELQQMITELEERRKARVAQGIDEQEEEEMMDQLRMMEEEMQDVSSMLHPIDYLDGVGTNICDASGTCADLFESMVLILSTSAIIGAKGSNVPHFYSGLPFWIVASGNIGCSLVTYYVHVQERYTSRQLRWSLRFNLILVIVGVQLVQIAVSYIEWFRGSITFTTFWHFLLISTMGQLAPEVCIMSSEYFTSVDYWPVQSLAQKANLGVVQVVLQGLAQGFMSTGIPAVTMIAVVMLTWTLENHFGLALLSASSVSGTGFQGSIASYGAVAANAHKIVHLTTYHSMTRHRANICSVVGENTAHSGSMVSAVNAFSATFNMALTLLAQTYTRRGLNYQSVSGPPLSQWSQAGLVLGAVMTMVFTANTTQSCLQTSKAFMRFCKESPEVSRRKGVSFPNSHIRPLKILTSYGTITSMRFVLSPMINTLVCPMLGGFFLGINGLLFLVSGANVLVLCLSILLINSGQAWVCARRYILYGSLRDSEGTVMGPDSPHYQNLGVGTMIGGPWKELAGPALNNFVKFLGIFALVTSKLYDPTPEATWHLGFVSLAGSIFLIIASRFGLSLALNFITTFLKQRQLQRASDEDSDEEDDDDEVGSRSVAT
eukprot:CAMPEP_0170598924 /NCGR_PEP_ID=MMETSP0224-20130122/16512_1 /TAXON_ID=285029 /ORGANISM="Togula jolla, Strain CCCM 725" /LENGTH=902 /DNA_ID=CAMNT_0010923519 /DNA_START=123 /DNA_END=2827 /DNA_ORIENTATION=+